MSALTSAVNRPTGARGIIAGTISNGATWSEAFEITENGTFVTNADTWDWKLKLRKTYDSGADLTLTTDDGTLTVVNGASSTTVTILVAYTAMTDLEGEYIIDLASKDGSNVVVHWGHGSVTIRNEPVWD